MAHTEGVSESRKGAKGLVSVTLKITLNTRTGLRGGGPGIRVEYSGVYELGDIGHIGLGSVTRGARGPLF